MFLVEIVVRWNPFPTILPAIYVLLALQLCKLEILVIPGKILLNKRNACPLFNFPYYFHLINEIIGTDLSIPHLLSFRLIPFLSGNDVYLVC